MRVYEAEISYKATLNEVEGRTLNEPAKAYEYLKDINELYPVQGKRLAGDLRVRIATIRGFRNGNQYDDRNGYHFSTTPTKKAASCGAAAS